MAAFALLLGWSNAMAQASYNHSWTDGNVVAEGEYFLYNIGAKRFLDNGMNWGTRATVDNAGKEFTLTASNGNYTINTGVKTRYGGGGAGDFLNDGGYMDGASTEWTFNSVSVAGYTNVYTLQVGENYLVYQTDADENPTCNVTSLSGTNNDYWLLITKAKREAVKDYTFLLDNTCFNRPWENKAWTLDVTSTGSQGNSTPDQSGGNVENRCAESYRNAFTYLQNATGTIAEGRYKLYNQGFYRLDGGSGAAQIAANDDVADMKVFNGSGEGTVASMGGASTAFSAGQYVNSVETFVNTGSLSVGIKNANNMNWVIWSNFYLEYLGQCVMDYAIELPDGGAMAADTWYYFDIAAAADNYTATATTLGDIICVTDGHTLTSAAAGTVTLTAEDNSLAAGRYYVKSSSNNNLEIAVASYSYSVSSATADKAYIQAGQTVTVSYTVSTNDPGATLTQDYSGVLFGDEPVSVTPTASGFTFTVPTVTANTPYTLSIPAGAIKYNEENKNAAQNIILNTPAVFDGIYFLKAAATYDGTSEGTSAAVGKYLARGLNYGTHATLDKYGLPVQITTDGNNATTIQAYDTKRYFFHANDNDCFADQASLAASIYFTVTVNNGKLLIHNNSMDPNTYLKYNTSAANDANIGVFDDGTGTNNGPIIMWTTEDASSHATVMQSYKDGQAATAAAAAYASGNYASLNGITTVSALEAELEANYIKGDFVSPSPIESISEKYQGVQPGSGNTTETVYSNTINITEPGFYKFSMQAFYRAGGNDVTQDMHTKGVDFPPVVLFFGDSETQIKSIYDEGGLAYGIEDGYFETETVGGAPVQYNEKWYTNGQHNSVIIFKKDYYHNNVYFYAPAAGEYTYGVKYMGFANANAQWFIYSPESVEITSYAAAANAADYTALQDAIDTYDGATWGFETGEYAPYNNVEAIENIAAAKAIDKNAVNSKLLVNSLTTKLALSAANVSEVNAFYKGDFDGYAEDNSSPLDYTPAGWTASDNMRMMLKDNGTYPGLADASASTAMMSWSGGITYGETTGYEMPLAAHTIYELQFKAAGWDGQTRGNLTVNVKKGSEGMVNMNLGSADKDIAGKNAAAGLTSFSVYFVTGEEGNYVFSISSPNNMVLTDFDLRKAVNQYLEFADGSVPTYAPGTYPTVKITRSLTANKWATGVYPFAISGVSGLTTVKMSDYDAGTGELSFSTGATVANQPFMMKATSAMSEISLNNVEVAATSAEDQTISDITMKGVYSAGTVPASDGDKYRYAVDSSTNTLRKVTGGSVAIAPYRAYFELDNATSARSVIRLNFEDITGIENVEAAPAATAKKNGAYLENGKIVIYKNGMKFNATGAKLK